MVYSRAMRLRARQRAPALGRRERRHDRQRSNAPRRVPSRSAACSTSSARQARTRDLGARRPLPQETAALWQIWGVNLVEAYGQTETGGAFISGQPQPFREARQCRDRPCMAGRSTRRRRADSGQGPDQFEGYWNEPDGDAADQWTASDWLHTGDVGEWQEGNPAPDRPRARFPGHRGRQDHLALHDREARCARAPISPRRSCSARAQISHRADRDRLRLGRRLGARRDVQLTPGFTSLVQKRGRSRGLIKARSTRPTGNSPASSRSRSFRILPKELDPEQDGEPVTRPARSSAT